MSKRRAAFLTLGCKVNQYETDAMEEILEKAGYEIVSFKETADVYIINTCSVTNMADRKSRQMIHPVRLPILLTESQDRCCTKPER